MPLKKPRTRTSRPSRPRGRPCVFLDRDGTISREAGYINHADRIELLPGSAAAIRRLNERDVLAIVVTNQAGVARGYLTETVLKKIHARLEELLARRKARLDAIYYAPTHPEAKIVRYRREDNLRKPGIGMIRRAGRRFGIDLSRSYVVGDKISDIELARNASIKGVFVLSGYGLGAYRYQRRSWPVQPDHVAEDLKGAVSWILKDLRARNREK